MVKVEEILARKIEGRPLSPKEYEMLSKVVDLIEKQTTVRIATPKPEAPDTATEELRDAIPEKYFKQDLLEVEDLPEHIANIIQEAEFRTMGDLFMVMRNDPDQILKLQGIGPRSMEKIQELVAAVEAEMSPAEAVDEEVAEAADVAPQAEVAAEPAAEAAEAIAEAIAETVVEPPAEEPIDTAEVVEEPAAEISPVEETAEPEVSEENEMSFEDLFKLQSEAIIPDRVTDDDDSEDDEFSGKGKGKKKKKKRGEIVYDPETDLTVRKKRHKRGQDEWGDW